MKLRFMGIDIKKISVVILLFIMPHILYSKDHGTKLWLNSAGTITFDSLKAGRRFFVDSGNNIKIRYRFLDSLKTDNPDLINDLLKMYKFLNVQKKGGKYTLKGFEKIKTDVLGGGLELGGKSLVGGVFLTYVYHERYAFDAGYGNGSLSSIFASVTAENIFYAAFSYLGGESNVKAETGVGLGFGKAVFTESAPIFLLEDTTGVYNGVFIPFTIGVRYQKKDSGFIFKASINPVVFTSPIIKFKLFFNFGLGYAFEL